MTHRGENITDKEVDLEQLRHIYESPKVPETLSAIVEDVKMEAAKQQRSDTQQQNTQHSKGGSPFWKKAVGIAAAIAISTTAFGVGVHNNEAFAQSVAEIPLLAGLAKVFTVKEIRTIDDEITMDIKIPGIEGLKDKQLQEKINQEVTQKVELTVKEAKAQMLADKEAWLATGGNEEDYMPMEIAVDYQVKCINENVLSFMVWKTQTMASAYFDETYYNYDLKANKELTLADLLGQDYITIANAQISTEIEQRAQEEGAMYWDGTDGIAGFATITDDQAFYVNDSGNPVVVFNKYEIAPGYMGIQTFEIK